MPVFDQNNALCQGIAKLGMWPQGTANPLVLTDNSAADGTLANRFVAQVDNEMVATTSDWYGCGARQLRERHVEVSSMRRSRGAGTAASARELAQLASDAANSESLAAEALAEAVSSRMCI